MTDYNKVFVDWPAALQDADVKNKADASSEVFSTLAGRNRWFYEQLTGVGPGTPEETPMSRRNPQGLVGIDHSGPPFGQALRHTVWGWTSIRYSGSNPLAVNRTFVLDQEETVIPISFFMKPAPNLKNTPHSRVNLNVRIFNSGAATSAITPTLLLGGERKTLSSQNVGAGAFTVLFWNAAADAVSVFNGLNQGRIIIKRTANDVELLSSSLCMINKFGY